MVVNSILSIFCVSVLPFQYKRRILSSCYFVSRWGMWGIPLCLFSRWTKSPRTLKTELPPPEVIQDLRTVCHESLAEPTHRRIAAQRQPANTRSERAQEMIRQRGKFLSKIVVKMNRQAGTTFPKLDTMRWSKKLQRIHVTLAILLQVRNLKA